MSDGKTHERINILFLVIGIAVAAVLITKSWFFEGIFVIVGYIIGTFFLNPDLDLKSRPYRRWGPLRFIWIPYQTFKHRSIWTHGYIISDIIRYAYLATWYVIVLLLVGLIFKLPFGDYLNNTKLFLDEHKLYVYSIVFGNILSSSAHTITDKTSSLYKKHFK